MTGLLIILGTFALACLCMENMDRKREIRNLKNDLRSAKGDIERSRKELYSYREREAILLDYLKIEYKSHPYKMTVVEKRK